MTAQFKRNFREIDVFCQFNGICRTISATGPHISTVWEQRKYPLRSGKVPKSFGREAEEASAVHSQRHEQIKNVKK